MDKEYERPNTVSGLIAKHTELCRLRDSYRKEIKKITVDLEHLEACIRLFDPDAKNQYAPKKRVERGSLKRFLLSTLREADSPLTSRQICLAWIAHHKLKTDDKTFIETRKRFGSCIKISVRQGLVECVGKSEHNEPWGSYKLWQIKKEEGQ